MGLSALTRTLAALLIVVLLTGCAADATLEPVPERDRTPDSQPGRPPAAPAPEPQPAPDAEATPDPSPAPPSSSQAPRVTRAVVTRHTDGDTARFRLEDGTEERVRFIGIDTPEVHGQVEPYGREASAYTARAIPVGTTVWLETDVELRDRYDRMLAYIWLDVPDSASDAEVRAKMLNARLLIDGYAQVYTFPPNVRYVEYFRAYQTEAREAGVGLWGLDANPANAPPGNGTTVYLTRTGEKYHADGCRHLAKSQIATTLGEAKARGYEPCKVCRPPR